MSVVPPPTRCLKPLPSLIPRTPGDDSPPLVCRPLFDELCVLANGDIVCSSGDVNGQRVYGNVSTDRPADVFDGSGYRELREWQLHSRPDSWCPAIRFHCPLRATPARADKELTGHPVKVLKLEPTSLCNLRCPGCPVVTNFVDNEHLHEHRAHKLLPVETMLDVVNQLPDLETIHYYNFGEPLLHKGTIPFLRETRRRRPDIWIATNTNGLVMTAAQIDALATEVLLNHVVFSIDGATPASYATYRIGGDLSRALDNLRALADAVRAAGTGGRVNITWQYILFEWNDSDKETALAMKFAGDIGVPIDWVITSGFGASQRFLQGSAEIAQLRSGGSYSVSPAAPALLAKRLAPQGISDSVVYQKFTGACELLAFPDGRSRGGRWSAMMRLRPWRRTGAGRYRARFRADVSAIAAPLGATLLFEFGVYNRTSQTFATAMPEPLRLGVRLLTASGKLIRELPGVILPRGAAEPNGHGSVALKVALPDEPGEYRLLVDVVHEGACWFHERGSQPWECRLRLQ